MSRYFPPFKFGVIGNPIAYSLSPFIHQAFAEQFGFKLTYDKIQTEEKEFEGLINDLKNQGYLGLNITAPFKTLAYKLAQQRSTRAEMAKAVNTLKFEADYILGENTDGIGFIRDLQDNLGWKIANKKILIFGAGGAVRGILVSVLEEKPSRVVIVNRDTSRIAQLQQDFAHIKILQWLSFNQLSELKNIQFDLIINSIPASTNFQFLPSTLALSENACFYDLNYQDISLNKSWIIDLKKQFPFISFHNGLGMLVEQAAESFQIWTGLFPKTQPTIQKLKSAI